MQQKANPLFLQCETGLHAGSGSDLGIIDLPIQRERHTDFPKIEGSSLKGSIREHFENIYPNDQKNIFALFGTDSSVQGDATQAGAIGIADARLLLFPVKSMKGVFAYVTCPRVLHKFIYDMNLCEGKPTDDLTVPPEHTSSPDNNLLLRNNKIVLEQYTFELKKDPMVAAFGEWLANRLFPNESNYWSEKLKKDIVVLSDDDFRDFVMLSTEVITRIKIDSETGTVANGALFTEEYLPAESILYSLILTRGEFITAKKLVEKENNESDLMDETTIRNFFADTLTGEKNSIIQLGGNATLGKGIIKTTFIN